MDWSTLFSLPFISFPKDVCKHLCPPFPNVYEYRRGLWPWHLTYWTINLPRFSFWGKAFRVIHCTRLGIPTDRPIDIRKAVPYIGTFLRRARLAKMIVWRFDIFTIVGRFVIFSLMSYFRSKDTYCSVYFSLCVLLAIWRRLRTHQKLNTIENLPKYGNMSVGRFVA